MSKKVNYNVKLEQWDLFARQMCTDIWNVVSSGISLPFLLARNGGFLECMMRVSNIFSFWLFTYCLVKKLNQI